MNKQLLFTKQILILKELLMLLRQILSLINLTQREYMQTILIYKIIASQRNYKLLHGIILLT